MYLKAVHLSDICNGVGTAIDPNFWDGRCICQTQYQWPMTMNLQHLEWLEWRKTLTLVLSLGRHCQLPIPLGKYGDRNTSIRMGTFLSLMETMFLNNGKTNGLSTHEY